MGLHTPKPTLSVGHKCNRWTVIRAARIPLVRKSGQVTPRYHCRCVCGQTAVIPQPRLNPGSTTAATQCVDCGRKAFIREIASRYTKRDLERKMPGYKSLAKFAKQALGVDLATAKKVFSLMGVEWDLRLKKRNLTGETFGYWTVKEKLMRKGVPRYRCVCRCGKEGVVNQAHLLDGNSTKCRKCSSEAISGEKSVHWKGHGELSATFITITKAGARERGLPWRVSAEYLYDLYVKQERRCALSGIKISLKRTRNPGTRSYPQTASIDRIDSDGGYIEGNVQWVHKDVNLMKNKFDQGYFVSMCKRIAANCNASGR